MAIQELENLFRSEIGIKAMFQEDESIKIQTNDLQFRLVKLCQILVQENNKLTRRIEALES